MADTKVFSFPENDGGNGIAFNRWLADCARKGVVIDWERMI